MLADNPAANGDSYKLLFVTHNFGTSGGVFNNSPTGVWYDGTYWNLYSEQDSAFAPGVVFNVFAVDTGVNAFVHQATIANSAANYTIIDNPALNGNAGATIIVTHNWNPGEVAAGEVVDKSPLGVWYDGANWTIFNQDGSQIPDTACFNVLICDNIPTAIKNYNAENTLCISPNPAKSNIQVSNGQEVISQIVIFNSLGENVYTAANAKPQSINQINVSSFPAGVYVLEVKTEKGVKVSKFVKE